MCSPEALPKHTVPTAAPHPVFGFLVGAGGEERSDGLPVAIQGSQMQGRPALLRRRDPAGAAARGGASAGARTASVLSPACELVSARAWRAPVSLRAAFTAAAGIAGPAASASLHLLR